ncbi:uncharacterized protein LOC115582046 isoform X2 [Scomber scombrus]|uniref:Uncharacterized protein LOC115582046 isoform X2 n=1 Tax=Scomber scombrus TaxID=13677 RepID=A0AAV1NXW3_SCOSC
MEEIMAGNITRSVTKDILKKISSEIIQGLFHSSACKFNVVDSIYSLNHYTAGVILFGDRTAVLRQSLSKVTREISAAIETETRQQSECQLWTLVRKPRLTASRFREICHVRGESSAKALASRILRGTPQTAAMKRGLDLEAEILRQYSEFCDVSVTSSGVIIHPDAPHLGASPDAKVFNPCEEPPRCGKRSPIPPTQKNGLD